MRVLSMLAHITLVMPAALAFAAARPGNLNERDVVILIGEQFSPGLTADLQLGHQQPIAESIHLGMAMVAEPLQGRLQAWTMGLKANRCLQRCAKFLTAAAVLQHFVH